MFGLVSEKRLKNLQGDLDVAEYLLNTEKANNEALEERLKSREHQLMMLKNKVDKLINKGVPKFHCVLLFFVQNRL